MERGVESVPSPLSTRTHPGWCSGVFSGLWLTPQRPSSVLTTTYFPQNVVPCSYHAEAHLPLFCPLTQLPAVYRYQLGISPSGRAQCLLETWKHTSLVLWLNIIYRNFRLASSLFPAAKGPLKWCFAFFRQTSSWALLCRSPYMVLVLILRALTS